LLITARINATSPLGNLPAVKPIGLANWWWNLVGSLQTPKITVTQSQNPERKSSTVQRVIQVLRPRPAGKGSNTLHHPCRHLVARKFDGNALRVGMVLLAT
jgi:hypothetical protein